MKKEGFMQRAISQVAREERNSYKEFLRRKREEEHKSKQKEQKENDNRNIEANSKALSKNEREE